MNRKTYRILRLLAAVPGLYPLLAFLTVRRVIIRGRSMSPTLVHGERVLFDRLAYRIQRPRRGDIVLARHPSQRRLRIIKRIVGVPEEGVADVEGIVVALSPTLMDEAKANDPSAARFALGPDEYFLLGDARDVSADSRQFGPVRRRDILARAWLVYWPLARFRWLSTD